MVQTVSQMYYLFTTISAILLGMNSILFFFCVYVLWGQKCRSRRILLCSSIVQFCLCLAQGALFVAYLSIAYTVYVNEAESYLLHLSGYALPSYIIYIINNAIEGVLLIWRIYVLYSHNIKVCIPMIILLTLQVGFGGATAKGTATENVVAARIRAFSLVTWALIAAVNICATILIFIRVWIARQRAITLLSKSKYQSTIIMVVECGALLTITSLAMLVVHAVEHHVGIAGLGITTQVATMVPLLIIARHGILSRQENRRPLTSQIPLRISVVRTEDTRVDTPVKFTRKNRLPSDPFPVYPGGDHPKPFCDVARPGSTSREEDLEVGSPLSSDKT
ncbi:hypothetical protein OG21DRAFT_632148 [Imleria badia]|nr:hypothetical protein OG21DRAFT_632148 [Imleria badia]